MTSRAGAIPEAQRRFEGSGFVAGLARRVEPSDYL